MSAEGQPLLSADDVVAALKAGALDSWTGREIREALARFDAVISVCSGCRSLLEYPAGTRIVADGLCPLCTQAQEP
ncbi:MAG: hypothetical protein WB974_09390 [Acidobacteriaceae bacterium]